MRGRTKNTARARARKSRGLVDGAGGGRGAWGGQKKKKYIELSTLAPTREYRTRRRRERLSRDIYIMDIDFFSMYILE